MLNPFYDYLSPKRNSQGWFGFLGTFVFLSIIAAVIIFFIANLIIDYRQTYWQG